MCQGLERSLNLKLWVIKWNQPVNKQVFYFKEVRQRQDALCPQGVLGQQLRWDWSLYLRIRVELGAS